MTRCFSGVLTILDHGACQIRIDGIFLVLKEYQQPENGTHEKWKERSAESISEKRGKLAHFVRDAKRDQRGP